MIPSGTFCRERKKMAQRVSIATLGYASAASSNAAALTASTDYSFSWSNSRWVNHLMIQNNDTNNLHFDLDTAANAGSPMLAPGQTIFLDVQTSVLHLYSAGTPNVNGSSANNIVVRGWL